MISLEMASTRKVETDAELGEWAAVTSAMEEMMQGLASEVCFSVAPGLAVFGLVLNAPYTAEWLQEITSAIADFEDGRMTCKVWGGSGKRNWSAKAWKFFNDPD